MNHEKQISYKDEVDDIDYRNGYSISDFGEVIPFNLLNKFQVKQVREIIQKEIKILLNLQLIESRLDDLELKVEVLENDWENK